MVRPCLLAASQEFLEFPPYHLEPPIQHSQLADLALALPLLVARPPSLSLVTLGVTVLLTLLANTDKTLEHQLLSVPSAFVTHVHPLLAHHLEVRPLSSSQYCALELLRTSNPHLNPGFRKNSKPIDFVDFP